MKYIEKDDSNNKKSYYMDRDHSLIRKTYKPSYKKILWPINVEIYDVDDKRLKKELCLIVTNLPVDWKKHDIIWFFREYFYKLAINENVFFPLIEQVYLIKNESSAILACHDGISKETIESLSNCIIKNVRDKKKVIFTIYPYYKRYEVEEKEKESEKEKEKENERKEKKEYEKEKENYSANEKNVVRKLRRCSLTPPRKNGTEWPSNVDLRNCNDMELRRKLCVFGRYKPLHWGIKELSEFLKYYFYSLKKDNYNFEIPEICDMWADKGTHLVTFACKNEKSRYSMLLIRACYLNEEDAKNNLKNLLRGWIEFEKWTPFKNTTNPRYRSYKIGRSDYNKYSSIHDHAIDKNYRRRNYRKTLYDELSRNRTNFRKNMNLSKLNNDSNYYFNKEDRRNYDHMSSYKKRSPSPFFKKYKKRYSRSSSKNYYKKKYRKSKSFDSHKNNEYTWAKNKSYNKKTSDSFSEKSYRK